MSLTFAQMKGVIQEIKPLLEDVQFSHCTAVHERKFILHFKNHISLLLCFQQPFLRFHLTRHPWKDHIHVFSKKLTEELHRWNLVSCSLLNDDKILELAFKKGDESKRLICEFIPKKVNCYLIDNQNQIIHSLIPTKNAHYIAPTFQEQKSEQLEILNSLSIENNYLSLETENLFNEQKQRAEEQLKSKFKQIIRSRQKFAEELKNALNWEQVQHEATLLQSNLFKIKKGMSTIHVNDWLQDNREVEVTLDPTISPTEEISKRFQKSKKLKRAIEPLKRQLEQTDKNEEKTCLLLEQLKQIQREDEFKQFCKKNYLLPLKKTVEKNVLPALPYREFITATGLQIWVGKSDKDNDQLTFRYANGSDFWLHAHDVPGSHVVLHLGKQSTPDDESLKDAIQAALFFSKAKDRQEGDVCITQCKYVTRFGKNQPGKVQISHHRVVFAKIDQTRLRHLRERKKELS